MLQGHGEMHRPWQKKNSILAKVFSKGMVVFTYLVLNFFLTNVVLLKCRNILVFLPMRKLFCHGLMYFTYPQQSQLNAIQWIFLQFCKFCESGLFTIRQATRKGRNPMAEWPTDGAVVTFTFYLHFC